MLRRMEMLVALVVIAAVIGSPVQGTRAEVRSPGSPSTPPGRDTVRLLSSPAGGVSFRLDVPWKGLSVEPVSLAGQQYTRISIPGWTLGAATTAGKLALWATGSNLDLIDTYLLFGDPATQLLIAPGAAPVAPDIGVQCLPGTGNAELIWLNRVEDPYYEVWRGTTPYFDPAQGQGNQIAQLWGEPYGSMGEVSYTDDGVDRYFSDPSDPQMAPVEVIGDPGANYFWVVRGRDGDTVSGNSNRVGEFEYSLRRP